MKIFRRQKTEYEKELRRCLVMVNQRIQYNCDLRKKAIKLKQYERADYHFILMMKAELQAIRIEQIIAEVEYFINKKPIILK